MNRHFKRIVAVLASLMLLTLSLPAGVLATSFGPSDWEVTAGQWTITDSSLAATGTGTNTVWNKTATLPSGEYNVIMNYNFAGVKSVETLRIALGTSTRGDKILLTVQYSNSQLLIQLQSWDGSNWNTYLAKGWDMVGGTDGSILLHRPAASNKLQLVVTDNRNYRCEYETGEIAAVLNQATTLGLITLEGSQVTLSNVEIIDGPLTDWEITAGEWTISETALTATGSGTNTVWNREISLPSSGFKVSMNYAFAGQKNVETMRVALGTTSRGDKLLATVQYSNSQLMMQLQSWDGANWTTYFSKGWDAVSSKNGTLTLYRAAGADTLHFTVTDNVGYQFDYETPAIASILSQATTLGLLTLDGSQVAFSNVEVAGGPVVEWPITAGQWTVTDNAVTATGAGENKIWKQSASLTGGFTVSLNYAFAGVQNIETMRISLGTTSRGDKILATVKYSNSQLLIELQSWDGTNWTTYFSKGWDAVNGPSGTITFHRDFRSHTLQFSIADTGSYRYDYETPAIYDLLDPIRTLGLFTLDGSQVTFSNVDVIQGVVSDWAGMDSQWSSGNANGQYFVEGDTDAYSQIAYNAQRFADQWQFTTAMGFLGSNTVGEPDRISGRIILSDVNNSVIGILSAQHNPTAGTAYVQFQALSDGVWVTLYTMNWQAITGNVLHFTLSSTEAGKLRLQITDGGSLSVDETLSHAALNNMRTLGLAADASQIHFGSLAVTSLLPTSTYSDLAAQSYNDLIANYWNSAGNYIYATHGGTIRPDPNDLGSPWERFTMVSVLDQYRRMTGSADAQSKIEADMNKFFELYRDSASSTTSSAACNVGDGTYNVASDDAGWAAMLYMTYYNACIGSTNATTRERAGYLREWAKTTFNNAFDRWRYDVNGVFEGITYGDAAERGYYTSLYAVGLATAAFQIYDSDNTLTAYRDKATMIVDALNQYHTRSDGLYWCDVLKDATRTPNGTERPYDIREAGSVSFLGGNMAMAALNGRLYRTTGDTAYLERALKGMDAIIATEVSGGIYLNDRDGWTDGQFAYMFASDALTLPGVDPRCEQLLYSTAVSIGANARTSDGHYKAEWGGGNAWINVGTTPEQIMTSSDTVQMLMAAMKASMA